MDCVFFVEGLEMSEIRTFETGATRDADTGKYDFEGFLSPAVLDRYAQYMHRHRKQSDGNLRASDNWQKGIPKDQYMKSLLRHVIDVWMHMRSGPHVPKEPDVQEALCAVMFNTMGLLFEIMKDEVKGKDAS